MNSITLRGYAVVCWTVASAIAGSLWSCKAPARHEPSRAAATLSPGMEGPLRDAPFVVVLGIAQDAGFPQAGCQKECCSGVWNAKMLQRSVASLGIVDPVSGERWMIDATPDFPDQLHRLDSVSRHRDEQGPLDGIFLTHAHIGHYTGLMFLGHESMGAQGVRVYAMPRMSAFLTSNGPWDQLVRYDNINLLPIHEGAQIKLNDRLTVVPFRVPHREEYSEVVGFRIIGPNRSVIYLPDIDKWERWDTPIEELIQQNDRAYLDGTFFDGDELPGRNMAAIPHPFVIDSIARFSESLSDADRAKIHFIHFNHTNDLLRPPSAADSKIRYWHMNAAREMDEFEL